MAENCRNTPSVQSRLDFDSKSLSADRSVTTPSVARGAVPGSFLFLPKNSERLDP